jgi:ABC-type transporter Mla subunit MlaD
LTPVFTVVRIFLRDAIAAVNEIADATADKFDQLDTKLDGLAKMLQQLREGNESARARVQDLPNPLPRRGLNS